LPARPRLPVRLPAATCARPSASADVAASPEPRARDCAQRGSCAPRTCLLHGACALAHRAAWRPSVHEPDHRYRCLLRARRERPGCRAAESEDELATPHVWMTKFSKWKAPLPGGQARRNKLLVSWGPLVIAAPLAGSTYACLLPGCISRLAVRKGSDSTKIARTFC
jgi:hypothetical protein